MGNTSSSNTESFDDFYHIIDYIATYYILTMDFKSLSKLTEKEYCDKLVVLTSDIIDRYFNDVQVTYLAQRIKNGVEVNEMNSEKVKFMNKDNLDEYDISNDTNKSIKKKRVCIGIAKFYIKIAHIFSAIIMTINPVYSYKDETGQTVKVPLMEKDTIPKGVDRKLYKLNICDNRIRALNKIKDELEDSDVHEPGTVTLQPKICDINTNKSGDASGEVKTLENEPGIPELMKLYLDDEYDYSTGIFTGMSEKTQKQFKKDLKTFYTVFTGNDTMPEYITKFSDIKLKDYNKTKGCQEGQFKTKYTVDKTDELFVKYANNIKNMIHNAASNQNKLLEVINDIFTYVIDPYTNKRVIRINPELTDELLQKVVEKTRRYIINLYINCEKDYAQGVKLFEAIVESKIIETTQAQIARLKLDADELLKETGPIPPILPVDAPLPVEPIPVQPDALEEPDKKEFAPPIQDNPIQDNLIQDNLPPPIQDNLPPPIQDNLPPPIQDNLPPPIQDNLPPPIQDNLPPPIQVNLPPPIQDNPIQDNPIQDNPIQDNMPPPMQNPPPPIAPNIAPDPFLNANPIMNDKTLIPPPMLPKETNPVLDPIVAADQRIAIPPPVQEPPIANKKVAFENPV